ncbi:hypothetical protein LOD99_14880 [Oopsacas minuta]|uniref:ATPase expression protein 2, mitochondrial n=1 Tax=Oopsacas minuta TaxID=111878 RepID=A0AAV7KDQ3_9METZ|nr:hypothetical protein LOD99_14880 [Oopsacas minuta]
MRIITLFTRKLDLPILRHFSTLPSLTPSQDPPPVDEPTNLIVKAMSTKFLDNTKPHKYQTIPHPHSYDVTHCMVFVSSYIAALHNLDCPDLDPLLRNLEECWCEILEYFHLKEHPKNNYYYLLHEVANTNIFRENIFAFRTEFQIQTFNLIYEMKILSPLLLRISQKIRKTKNFGVNEYERLSSLLFNSGNVQYNHISNYKSERNRSKLFFDLIDEMKSLLLKPTKQICMQALESLFHVNNRRNERTITLVRSVISEHPELARDPRVIVLSSRTSGKLDLIQATENMTLQNCPVNEYSIQELLDGMIYGGEMSLDSHGTYIPSFKSLKLTINVATNELLPFLTSKHLDLLFRAIRAVDLDRLAVRIYLLTRDKGLYPGEHGFEDLMFTVARNSNSRNPVLHIWYDICDRYYGSPPPWAYRVLIRALCYDKKYPTTGAEIFKRILRIRLEKDSIKTPSADHWAWSSDMCIAKIQAYSWAYAAQDVIQVVKEIIALNVPLTPKLIETLFMPNFNHPSLQSYLPIVLQLLFETNYPLCSSSIKRGIANRLHRSQALAYRKGRRNFSYQILGKDLAFEFDIDSSAVRNRINGTVADIVVKLILDENYICRNYEAINVMSKVSDIKNYFFYL